MTVFLPQHKLAYFAVPKAACTSVKTVLFEIDNHKWADRKENHSIHEIYPTLQFVHVNKHNIAGFQKFTVIRDPIERFLSAYRNRVIEKNEIANSRVAEKIRGLGLPLQPSLSTFISNLKDYRIARGIDHHVSPITAFLGREPEYFTDIYDISRTSDLFEKISKITGRKILPVARNTSGHASKHSENLSKQERIFLEDLYAEDYQIYGAYLIR